MGNIGIAIEIKKRRLAKELKRPNPSKEIIRRLEESIKRHINEMKSIKRGKERRKRILKSKSRH